MVISVSSDPLGVRIRCGPGIKLAARSRKQAGLNCRISHGTPEPCQLDSANVVRVSIRSGSEGVPGKERSPTASNSARNRRAADPGEHDRMLGECLLCGDAPIGPDNTCARCGARLLFRPESSGETVIDSSSIRPRSEDGGLSETMGASVPRAESPTLPLEVSPSVSPLSDTLTARAWRAATANLRDELVRHAADHEQAAARMAERARETRQWAEALDQLLQLLPLTAEDAFVAISDPASAGAEVTDSRWARAHDRCMRCGTTDRPHRSKGLCTLCYFRVWRGRAEPDHGDPQVVHVRTQPSTLKFPNAGRRSLHGAVIPEISDPRDTGSA
jgi:hypothetical protein